MWVGGRGKIEVICVNRCCLYDTLFFLVGDSQLQNGTLEVGEFFYNGRKDWLDVFLLFHGNLKAQFSRTMKQVRENTTNILLVSSSSLQSVLTTAEFIDDAKEAEPLLKRIFSLGKYNIAVITTDSSQPKIQRYKAPESLDNIKKIGQEDNQERNDDEEDSIDLTADSDDDDDDDDDNDDDPDYNDDDFINDDSSDDDESLYDDYQPPPTPPPSYSRNREDPDYTERDTQRIRRRDLFILYSFYFRYTPKWGLRINTRRKVPPSYYLEEKSLFNKHKLRFNFIHKYSFPVWFNQQTHIIC